MGREPMSSRVIRSLWRAAQNGRRSTNPAMRDAYRAYRDGVRFRVASATWSDDRKRDWMLQRLRVVVRDAARDVPFWAERFASVGFDPASPFSFDDFARLPVLEREEVRAAGESLRSRGVPGHLVRKDATGGSTGTPTELWKGPLERGWNESCSEHFLTRIGLPPGSRMAYLWGHHLDPTTRDSVRDRTRDWLEGVAWFDCMRLSTDVLLDYHERLSRFRPEGMICYASALASLADVVRRSGREPGYPARAFVTGAEKLFDHQRATITEAFGKPAHERYGGRDVGELAFQLDPLNSLDFSVDWANSLLEAEEDSAISPLLVTKLHADEMPMIRYRVGDVARFPVGSRPGTPALVLHEVVGRDMDRIWTIDGRWMHPAVVPHMMKDFPVRDFQLHQDRDYSVTVRVAPASGFDRSSGDDILKVLRANLPGLPVALLVEDEIPRTKANKWRPVSSDAVAPAAASIRGA